MHSSILSSLNPSQQQAVQCLDGPLLLLAGAGSGKTRVITHRIAWGIAERAFRPDQFLAVTFTNKAASEMRERIASLTSLQGRSLWIRTFHSMCAQLLREYPGYTGLESNFTVYDTRDQIQLIKQVLEDLPGAPATYKPQQLMKMFQNAKNSATGPAEAADLFSTYTHPDFIIDVYSRYQESLLKSNAADFGDLIMHALLMLEKDEKLCKTLSDRFTHIMVDEYQDTNHAQYRLIKRLCAARRNICVVGDDDQSIYNWRGADLRNILDFEKDFPDAAVIRLEENYRSTPEILQVAARVIERNEQRMGKEIYSNKPTGPLPVVQYCHSDTVEAEYTARNIVRLHQAGMDYRDMAVFVRTNWQTRSFEESFIQASIPYAVVGNLRFYERKEVKDLLSYLWFSMNPDDTVAFRRAISTPSRGIGEKTQAKVQRWAAAEGMNLAKACAEIQACPELRTAKIQKALLAFGSLIAKIQAAQSPIDCANAAFAGSGLQEYYQDESERLENMQQFIAAVQHFTEMHPDAGLHDFLVEISLYSDTDKTDNNGEQVQIMTVHSAKGLEFKTVFVSGLEQGLFPHFMSFEEEGRIEEERRLFYVAVTRAMEQLYLTYAEQRYSYGKVMYNEISQFLEEIPPELLQIDEASQSAPEQSFFRAGNSSHQGLRQGDRVEHPQYGRGTVTRCSGDQAMRQIHVDFGDRTCLFIEQYSNLKKID